MRGFLLYAALGALALPGADFEDRLQRSFPAQAGGRLVFNAEFGSIDVKAADVTSIELEVHRKVDVATREDADRIFKDLDFKVTHNAGEVQVRAEFRAGWKPSSEVGEGRRRFCRDGKCLEYASQLKLQHYTLRVPRRFNVDLTTSAGSISVAELEGEARSRTSGGALTFGRIRGAVSGRTSGGSITLAGSTGNADLETSGGAIHVGEVQGEVKALTSGGSITIERSAGKVNAKTSGGSIHVNAASAEIDAATSGGSITANLLADPKAPCRLATSAGNVTVYVPESARLEVDASTSVGRVSSELTTAAQGTPRKESLKASLNGGGPLLHLRTSAGNIHLRKGSGAPLRKEKSI